MCVSLQGISDWDQKYVECLRACVMKPEHLREFDLITGKLDRSMAMLIDEL